MILHKKGTEKKLSWLPDLVFIPFQALWVLDVQPEIGGTFDGVASQLLAFRGDFCGDADAKLVTALVKELTNAVDFPIVQTRVCLPLGLMRRQGALNYGWENDVTKICFSSSAPD